MDTYYESAAGETMTKERTMKVLHNHCMGKGEVQSFLTDMGDKEEYNKQKVMDWLGY